MLFQRNISDGRFRVADYDQIHFLVFITDLQRRSAIAPFYRTAKQKQVAAGPNSVQARVSERIPSPAQKNFFGAACFLLRTNRKTPAASRAARR
jgi:hypothetical protein